jgi:hypothetical protein
VFLNKFKRTFSRRFYLKKRQTHRHRRGNVKGRKRRRFCLKIERENPSDDVTVGDVKKEENEPEKLR